MNKTKIERFIRDNREGFDEYEMPAHLWDQIAQQLPVSQEVKETNKKGKLFYFMPKIWTIAASIVAIIGCFSVFYMSSKTESTDNIIANYSPEYGQKMVQYASLIETKREEIREIEKHNPVLYQEFATEIEKINQDYQNLKAELPQTPNQEELVKAMIQNLQVQLDILNRQLIIIQKVKEYKQNPMQSI
jgi:septal ring factor EnvC (AmiA/AmiB activator)